MKLSPRPPGARTAARCPAARSGWSTAREQQIGQGAQGARLTPLGLFLEPPGPFLTHLHTVYMAYSERLPTRLNLLAERACLSQVYTEYTISTKAFGDYQG